MTVTMQKVKGEPIINNTKIGFKSPLQQFIENNCIHCEFWKGKCRLDDQNGIARINLCITLSIAQPPAALTEMMQKAAQTQAIAEQTLKEAEAEVE